MSSLWVYDTIWNKGVCIDGRHICHIWHWLVFFCRYSPAVYFTVSFYTRYWKMTTTSLRGMSWGAAGTEHIVDCSLMRAQATSSRKSICDRKWPDVDSIYMMYAFTRQVFSMWKKIHFHHFLESEEIDNMLQTDRLCLHLPCRCRNCEWLVALDGLYSLMTSTGSSSISIIESSLIVERADTIILSIHFIPSIHPYAWQYVITSPFCTFFLLNQSGILLLLSLTVLQLSESFS